MSDQVHHDRCGQQQVEAVLVTRHVAKTWVSLDCVFELAAAELDTFGICPVQSNTFGRFTFRTQTHLQTPQRIVVGIGIVVEFRLDQPQNQVRLSGGERRPPFGESLGRSYRHVVESVPGQHGLPQRGLHHRM